jgi:hypothetical protein
VAFFSGLVPFALYPCLLLCFCLSLGFCADRIQFSAAYQEYNQGRGLVILKDEASIVGNDFEVHGETLQYNLNTGDILAHGKVKLLKDGDLTEAESLIYNMRTQKGKVRDFDSILQNTFIKGKTATLSPQNITILNGCATTCDHSHHHYKITARKMILIPGEKLFLKHASFYLGKRKILSMPAYKFDLGQKKSAGPLLIVPGYDKSRGIHTRLETDFFFHEGLYGTASISPSSRQGLDWSLEMALNPEGAVAGSLSLDESFDRFQGNRSRRASLSESWGRDRSEPGNFKVDFLQDRFNNNLENKELNLRLDWEKSLGRGWRARLDYALREDLDGDRYKLDDRIQSLDKLPGIQVRSPTTSLKSYPIKFRYGGGFSRFRENSFQGREDHGVSELFLDSFVELYQGGQASIRLNTKSRFTRYSGSQDREYFRGNLLVKRSLPGPFSMETRYNIHHVKGSSPFKTFDFLSPSEQITHRFNLRSTHWGGTLFQGSYNLKSDQFSQLSSFLQFRNQWKDWPYRLGLRTLYRPRANSSFRGWKLDRFFISGNLQRGENFETSLRAQYSNLRDRWENFSHSLDFLLLDRNKINLNSHYNPLSDEFTRLSLGVIRDLHCLEARLDWDFKQKELGLQLYLKQGSGDGLGISIDYENQLSVRPDLPGIDKY